MNAPPLETWRLFISIPLPAQVKAPVQRAQEQLRQSLPGAGIRWTSPDQFHLTLKFLGAVDSSKVEALSETLRRAAGQFPPLELQIEKVGCFPNPRAPRVIWVGVSDAADRLPVVQSSIERGVAPFTQEPSSEKFSGHITLGRVKTINRTDAARLGQEANRLSENVLARWTAREVLLMRSTLSPHGARHTEVLAAALAANPLNPHL